MELSHEFTVPLSVDETWEHFNDIASVAECFPGAQVTGGEGDTFEGSCKVKLGPIALVYNGSGTFVEKDEAAHRFVIDAKGKDKRGNGTAGAHVTLSMAEVTDGTKVEVLTDLAITGKPAQFGRGVMQDVSDKLLGQFVACLEDRFAQPAEEPAPAAAPAAAPADARAGADVQDGLPGDEASAPPRGTSASAAAAASQARTTRPGGVTGARKAEPSDSLNLGATVLPVVLKSFWKQIAAGLVALLGLKRLRSRRKRKAADASTPDD